VTDSVSLNRFRGGGGQVSAVPGGDPRRSSGTRMFVLAIAFVMFSVPFGELQNAVLGGMTVAKLMLPAVFLVLLAIRLAKTKLHPHFWLITAFVVATTPSFLLSEKYFDIAPNLVSYTILFLLLHNTLSRLGDLSTIFAGYFAGLLVVSLLSMTAFTVGVDAGAAVGRPLVEIWYGLPVMLGTEDNPNAFATLLVVGVPIALFLRQTTTSRWMRRVYGGGALLFLVVVALTFSRSGIAAAMVGGALAIYYAKSRPARSRQMLIAALIVLAVLGVVLAVSIVGLGMTEDAGGVSGGLSVFLNKELSQGYRFQIAEQYIPLVVENPLVGIGFGNLPPLMEKRTGLYNNSHNILFGVAIEFGLLAALLFTSLILLSLHSAARGMALAASRTDRATGACILAVLAGLFIHGMFHEIYVNLTFWLFIGLGGVYATLVRNSWLIRKESS
jgi:putative inorganic carbon (hco3(-)) transporter